jgi:dipeptidase D
MAISLAWAASATGATGAPAPDVPGEAAIRAAKHAVTAYRDDVVDTLARLVSYNTVADKDVPCDRNPRHQAFKAYLKQEATRLGLDFADYGCVAVIGLGKGDERVGLVAHGDVQPVDPGKWKKSPFELDRTSEPGRLLARGAEDDKGPIATALYAMKALKDQRVPLGKRIELYVYMAEESDWEPLEEFIKTHTLPQMNITLDAEYPAVTAEKGYGTLAVTLPGTAAAAPATGPWVKEFRGGFFGSQIPEDAQALVANATPALEAQIRARAGRQAGMRYQFEWKDKDLLVTAKGQSAHSSKPEDGVNAISMLADALAVQAWPDTAAGALVNFLNEMVGTGYYGEKFGSIAYRDTFMGPMTFAPTVIRRREGDAGGTELAINIRRPLGKSAEQLSNEINAPIAGADEDVRLLHGRQGSETARHRRRHQFAPVPACRQLRPGDAAHGLYGPFGTRVHHHQAIAAEPGDVHRRARRAGPLSRPACRPRAWPSMSRVFLSRTHFKGARARFRARITMLAARPSCQYWPRQIV